MYAPPVMERLQLPQSQMPTTFRLTASFPQNWHVYCERRREGVSAVERVSALKQARGRHIAGSKAP